MSNIPIKLNIVGDVGVGKTSLLRTFTTNIFTDCEYTGSMYENFSAVVSLDQKNYELALGDTAGQDEFDRIRPLSYPQTDIFLVSFSIMCNNSFENVELKWLPEVRCHCPTAAILLVGTKCDLRNNTKIIQFLAAENQTPISSTKALDIVQKEKLSGYIECSSLEMQNIKLVFETAIRSVLDKSNEASNQSKRNKCSIM